MTDRTRIIALGIIVFMVGVIVPYLWLKPADQVIDGPTTTNTIHQTTTQTNTITVLSTQTHTITIVKHRKRQS